MYSELTDDINKAILKSSNPDLNMAERKNLRRQLRYYISHPNMPESVVKRCQVALQQIQDFVPWYLNPWFVGMSCSLMFFILGLLY